MHNASHLVNTVCFYDQRHWNLLFHSILKDQYQAGGELYYISSESLDENPLIMELLSDIVDLNTSIQSWILQQVSRLNGKLTGTTDVTDGSKSALSFSIPDVLYSLAGLGFAWYLGSCIWYHYMSPISDIPGPFLASFSRLWLIRTLRNGRGASELVELHEKHGG